VAALADPSTYTFSEHLFWASAHKTHEEAWFLMETRWMLYFEDGDTLRLFAGAPRRWLAPGATITLHDAASYFGPLAFSAIATADGSEINVTVECASDRRPRELVVRVPHPAGLIAKSVQGGDYDATTETVRVRSFPGRARISVRF
jgi:hypothetical protein